MSDISFHFGGAVMIAECLLFAALFAAVALIAFVIGWLQPALPRARRVAVRAGLFAAGGVVLAMACGAIPSSSDGDAVANVLLWIFLALAVAGLGSLFLKA